MIDLTLPTAADVDITAPEIYSTPRLCRFCEEPISLPRLKARPTAYACVECLNARGDVPTIKLFTDTTLDGEVIQSFYNGKLDAYKAEHQRRVTKFTGCGRPSTVTPELLDEVTDALNDLTLRYLEEAGQLTPTNELEEQVTHG